MSQVNTKAPVSHHQGPKTNHNATRYTIPQRGCKPSGLTFEQALVLAARRQHVAEPSYVEPIRLGAPNWVLPGRRVG